MDTDSRYQQSLTNEGRYRLLVEAVTDYAIYMLDPTGIVSSWNAGAARFKGYRAEEIIGQHFSRFYTEEDRAAGVPAQALRTADVEGRFEAIGWRVRKDGTRFWANVVIDPIREPGGALVGFAKVTRDLTERRVIEEKLRRSEEQFRLLVQGVTDYAIYMLDPAGVISSWNSGARRIKGYDESEVVGRNFAMFYTPEDLAVDAPRRALETAAREGRFEKEGWRIRKDGTRFRAHVVIDPIWGTDGAIFGFAKVTRDVTERMEGQIALEKAREQLFQLQKMDAIGQLTGGVAHDFNNLLTIIIGGLHSIRRSKPDDEARIQRGVDIALQGAERAVSLTGRLLAFSRRQPLNPTPLDLNIHVRDMTNLLHSTLGEQIELEGVLAPRLWTIEADQNQLEAAILNLAVNARDAMPDGGKLTIETANVALDSHYAASEPGLAPGQYAMLAVSDNGSGMPEEIRTKVFEPFFTTKEVGRGTGLGLSMVYGFVKQSGGHVSIYSEPGQGTTVKMYFPRFAGALQRAAEPASPIASGSGDGEVVLVVEDNEGVRAYSSSVLRELGYDVIEAGDADQASAILSTDARIDLLFTDVVLPGRSGRELADEASRLRPGIRVLFTTGYSRNAIVHQGRLDPGVELLSKPFTFEQLAAKVRAILESGAT